MVKRRIRILVVDDSAVVRQMVSEYFAQDPEISGVSTAMDAAFAQRRIERDTPDVVLLDIEMPHTNGLSLLRSLKKKSPVPVIVFSAHSAEGSGNAIKALELGAIAVLSKPNGDNFLETMEELTAIVKGAVRVQQVQTTTSKETRYHKSYRSDVDLLSAFGTEQKSSASYGSLDTKVIAIGASTGGTEAIRKVLVGFPPSCPPILVVIHMPEGFTYRYAERLNKLCTIQVKEAEDGEPLKAGVALVAPGDRHLLVKKGKAEYISTLQNGPPIKRHKPSVEVLFRSVAAVVRHNALGIILTGMGSDGADGLYEMHRMGACTIAQNEETSIVFGMPKEAIKTGGVDRVLGIEQIPEYSIAWMNGSARWVN